MIATAAVIALSLCPPPPAERITCVHDGDSFIVNRERIRIADIDTPELNGKCPREKALAVKARNRLLAILREGFEIRREGKDRYGRTLAIVVNARGSIGDQLVREGLARTWSGRRQP